MQGYVNKTVMVESLLMDKWDKEVADHYHHDAHHEPTLSEFLNDMLTIQLHHWFEYNFPNVWHDEIPCREEEDY